MSFIEALNDYYEREEFLGNSYDEYLVTDESKRVHYLGSYYNPKDDLNTFAYFSIKENKFYIGLYRSPKYISEEMVENNLIEPMYLLEFNTEEDIINYFNNIIFEKVLYPNK